MKKMFLSTLIVLLVLSIRPYAFAPHAPATPQQVANITELKAYLSQLTASENPPGLSAVFVKQGEIAYNNAFGYADAPRNIKASSETDFSIHIIFLSG